MNKEPTYEPIEEEIVMTQDGNPTELVAPKTSFASMQFVDPDELPDFDEMEKGVNIAPQYYEFNAPGEIVRAMYNGMTTITSNKNGSRREIPTAVFQNRDGVFINAGANLVNQMRVLRSGAFVQIKYVGKEKTSSGNEIKKFEINLLKK